jgi:hypothetical protein
VIVETMPVPTPAAEVQPLAPLDATPAAPDAPSLPAARGGLSPELYTPN